MTGPTFHLSFDCPDCRKQWSEDASVRRDAECPRCGTVSRFTRARVIEAWPFPTKRAPQVPFKPTEA